MSVDIAPIIGELLHTKESVIVPGLGRFVSSYKPASIDYVQGILHPPSKFIKFDASVDTNSDSFVNYVSIKYSCTKADAQKSVDTFVQHSKEVISNREMMVIPDVGRIYLDYEQKFQFLQEDTNFNTTAFGLPNVQYYPVLRSKKEVEHVVSTADMKTKKGNSSPYASTLSQTLVPLAIAVIAVFLALGMYTQQSSVELVENFEAKPVAEEVHVNKSPAEFKETELPPEMRIREAPAEKTAYTEELDTDAMTLGPNAKHSIIIIGQFSKKEGVRKRVEQIYDLGYDVYTDVNNNLTRVGVQFSYEHTREVQKVLKLLRKKFDTSAFILKD